MKYRVFPILLTVALLLCACAPSGPEPSAEPSPTPAPEESSAAPGEPSPAPAAVPDKPPVEPSPEAEEEPPAEAAAVDLAAVRDAMAEGVGASDWLAMDADAIGNLYGLDGAWIAQAAGFATMAGTFPDEVALVEAVDEDAAARVAEKLQARLDEVQVQAETYDPDSYAKALECEVVTNGCFVRLLLSPKQSELADI